MSRRLLIAAFVFAAAVCVPAWFAAPASAESGAHRVPPTPPNHTPIGVTDRR